MQERNSMCSTVDSKIPNLLQLQNKCNVADTTWGYISFYKEITSQLEVSSTTAWRNMVIHEDVTCVKRFSLQSTSSTTTEDVFVILWIHQLEWDRDVISQSSGNSCGRMCVRKFSLVTSAARHKELYSICSTKRSVHIEATSGCTRVNVG